MPTKPLAFAEARLLLVDDEPDNLLLLETLLRAAGYHYLVATSDARRASELYSQHAIDLVLLDLHMPHLDGFGVMGQLTAIESDGYAPILVLSALNDESVRLAALDSGAQDYITKPFDQAEMLRRVRNLLEVRLLHKQLSKQNRQLDAAVRERTADLWDTHLDVLRRLGRAAEYRDNETGLHVTRMSRYAHLLGLAVGLSGDEADLLLHASPMHDIGKIGVPDHILLKPGPLTPEEWTLMRTHTSIGAELLAGNKSPLMEMARIIALTHHERWDGTGYPAGLKGEAIPLMGRIAAVADVFDALTSSRPYKRAWPVEQAVDEIRRGSGTHFDPRLVERFLAILPAILSIQARYSEVGEPVASAA